MILSSSWNLSYIQNEENNEQQSKKKKIANNISKRRNGIITDKHHHEASLFDGISSQVKLPFKARILESGFIRAESAVIGLLRGCIGILISIITTLF